MLPEKFPYDKFLAIKTEKDKLLESFVRGEKWFVPVIQRPSVCNHWGEICRYQDKSLENQLDALASYLTLKSDFIYSYLEPWVGVGVFASAFGCPIYWSESNAPYTMPIYKTLEEVVDFKSPNIKECEIMQMVLDTIRYFREKTGDMLDISLTDTQSTNNNASLIMDSCEFFMASITEPEALHPFLQAITDTMILFSDMQIEAIGSTLAGPGHIMVSMHGLKGIALSDDNLAIVSPASYENTALPYNNQISRHFGGIAIHSCGNWTQNVELLLKTEGLTMVDGAVGLSSDPTPNNPKIFKKAFLNKDIVLKVRLGVEELDLLKDIIDKNIKLIVEINTKGTIDEQNCLYDIAKEKIEGMVRKL